MCGILGQIITGSNDDKLNLEWLKSSLDQLSHRGPDFKKILIDQKKKFAFGHTRLSILDLSKRNNQPYTYKNFVLTYNGEIYNYLYLKKDLISKGYTFNTNGDTEVLIKSYDAYGLDFIKKLNGMFAFSLIDKDKNILIMARDKSGQKPLYYLKKKNDIFFSSQLGQLIKLSGKIDSNNVQEFFFKGFIGKEKTLVTDVKKVIPSSYLVIDINTGKHKESAYIPQTENFNNIDKKLEDYLQNILIDATKKCFDADVETAILLSGGIDSSIITALASTFKEKINTFSVTFGKKDFDESKYSKMISSHFNTNHNEIFIENLKFDEFINIIEKFDEPIIDSSIIPTYKIFEKVKKNYRVTIGGDGADELFGGYNHYRYYKIINFFKNKNLFNLLINNKIFKKTNILKNDLYCDVLKSTKNTFTCIPNYFNFEKQQKLFKKNFFNFGEGNKEIFFFKNNFDFEIKMHDFKNYLSSDILHKIDRCGMINSVEARSPFLNENVIHFAHNVLKDGDKNNYYKSKIILKKIAKKILPKKYDLNRKKRGFSLPLKHFLTEESWSNSIKDIILKNNEIFNADYVHHLFKNVNYSNNSEKIFGILFFKIWSKKYNLL